MTDTLTIEPEEGTDAAEAPEGAEGDDTKVSLPPNASTDPQEDEKGTDGEAGDRPEWLPEKFKSPEDMAKAYSELEKKQGSGEEADEADPDTGSDDDPDGTSPLDLQDVANEYLANDGELSEEMYNRFEQAGLSKDLVDSFIENQVSEGQRVKESLLETVGGEEAFEQISEWALANKEEAEIEAFNRAMQSGDLEVAKMALKGLRSDYVDANGQEPNLVTADDNNVRTGPEPYSSMDAVVEAMSNPKYKTDRGYRAEVDKRLAATDM